MAIRHNPDGTITVGIIREEVKVDSPKPEKAEGKKTTKTKKTK